MKIVANTPAHVVVDSNHEVIDVTYEASVNFTYCVAEQTKRHGVRYAEVNVSCVEYYAMKNGKDVQEKVKNAIANRHPLFWITKADTVMTDSNQTQKSMILLKMGQKVKIAGEILTVGESNVKGYYTLS